jgi:hypothetical protein
LKEGITDMAATLRTSCTRMVREGLLRFTYTQSIQSMCLVHTLQKIPYKHWRTGHIRPAPSTLHSTPLLGAHTVPVATDSEVMPAVTQTSQPCRGCTCAIYTDELQNTYLVWWLWHCFGHQVNDLRTLQLV